MKPAFLLKSILLLILVNGSYSVNAQITDDFIKGSIVLKNNETRNGFIRNDDFRRMNYKIKFKPTQESNRVFVFDTASIKSIVMEDGEIYDLLRYMPKSAKDSISVLARLMIKGKASLYKVYYRGAVVFIISNNQKTYPVQDDEIPMNSTVVTQNYYIQYLKSAFEDYDDLMAEIDKMEFTESGIVQLVKKYNLHNQSENKIIKMVEKSKGFIVLNADGGITNQDNNLLSFEGTYRVYFPKISKSTSFNWGLKHSTKRYSDQEQFGGISNGIPDPGYLDTSVHYKQSYWAIPFSVHENILNKRFRPYLFVGFTFFDFYKEVNTLYQEDNGAGFGNNYGVFFSWGGGIEADIYKGLLLRSEYRSENKRFTVGIGYHFKLN